VKLRTATNGMKISDKIFILEAPLSFLVWVYLATPIPGAFVGHFLSSWQSGAAIGGIMSGVLLAIFLIGEMINRKLFR